MKPNDFPVRNPNDFSVEKPVSFTVGPEVHEQIKRSTHMVQRSLSERISLVVQDAIYKVADDLTTVVDEALEAFEDAAKMVEEKVTPAYTVVVNGSVDPDAVAQQLADLFGGKTAEQSPSQTGGRDDSQSTERERLLRELYRYMSKYRVEGYAEYSSEAEDNTAGVNPKVSWVPAYAVEHFLRHIKEEFADSKPQYMD